MSRQSIQKIEQDILNSRDQLRRAAGLPPILPSVTHEIWHDPPIEELPTPPPDPFFRKVERCNPPDIIQHVGSVAEARALIDQTIFEYTEDKFPHEILVIKAPPGVGKTYQAVKHAERLADAGYRVGYFGPRHDFFTDLQVMAKNPLYWYEWLPRQDGDEDHMATCIHTASINNWMSKGYKGHKFCEQICKYVYINDECVYHRQKETSKKIIYGQHNHLVMGHPVKFDYLIGDESPLQAFLHKWFIPIDSIRPVGMDNEQLLTHIIEDMHQICIQELTDKDCVEGPDLILRLGGPDRILMAVDDMVDISVLRAPDIHGEDDANDAPYFHLPDLVPLLKREAQHVKNNQQYPYRIQLTAKGMTLYLKNSINTALPPHIIWLDATANQHVYEEIFGRPVRIVDAEVTLHGHVYQVTDRGNGKATLLQRQKSDQKEDATAKVDQLINLVTRLIRDHDYNLEKCGVITFKNVEYKFSDYRTGHFYAERGSNRFEDVEALFIIGTPMPDIPALISTAKCVFFNRDTPFNKNWITTKKKYQYIASDGSGQQIDIAGLWGDGDLTALLSTLREDEIIQAVHRARPMIRETDIWLLSNLPINELPPTRLYSMAELMHAPESVDMWQWNRFLSTLEELGKTQDTITVADILAKIPGAERHMIYKYFEKIDQQENSSWELSSISNNHGGRKSKVLRKKHQKVLNSSLRDIRA